MDSRSRSAAGSPEASKSVFAARQAWLRDHDQNCAELWLDEDPAIFAHVIKYLTNCGQPGVARLMPTDLQERTELR